MAMDLDRIMNEFGLDQDEALEVLKALKSSDLQTPPPRGQTRKASATPGKVKDYKFKPTVCAYTNFDEF